MRRIMAQKFLIRDFFAEKEHLSAGFYMEQDMDGKRVQRAGREAIEGLSGSFSEIRAIC